MGELNEKLRQNIHYVFYVKMFILCSRLPFPFLLFPSVVTGEKGTSVSSLSEGEGDSTESEAGPGDEVIG